MNNPSYLSELAQRIESEQPQLATRLYQAAAAWSQNMIRSVKCDGHIRHLLTLCGRCGGHGVVRETFAETVATEYGGMLMRTKGPEVACPDCRDARQFVETA